MSWLEPQVTRFLQAIAASCVVVPACLFGWDIYKTWMFASSFPPLQQLGGHCNHPPNSHDSIQGKIDERGNFESRKTAGYPSPLADKFASLMQPLLPEHSQDFENDSQFRPTSSLQIFHFLKKMVGGFSPHQTGVEMTDRNKITLDPFANNGLNVLLR